MTTIPRLGALLLAVPLVAACGDGATGPSFADTISTANAEYFAETAASYATTLRYAMEFGSPFDAPTPGAALRLAHPERALPPGFSAPHKGAAVTALLAQARSGGPGNSFPFFTRPPQGCSMTVRGATGDPEVPFDSDEDGIAEDYYYRLHCYFADSISAPDTLLSTEVEYIMWIKEDAGSLHGYTAHLSQRLANYDDAGRRYVTLLALDETLDLSTTRAIRRFAYVSSFESIGYGADLTIDIGDDVAATFTPVAGSSITAGAALPDGDLTVTGTMSWVDPASLVVRFALGTAPPLRYDDACGGGSNTPFTSGVLSGHLNGDDGLPSFAAAFTGCGVVNLSYDGMAAPSVP